MIITIAGPVHSDKTNIICERINDYLCSGHDVKLFYPIFLEKEEKYVIKGNDYKTKIIPISDLKDILSHITNSNKLIIFIDEFQFFDIKNSDYILQELSERDVEVIISGLDINYYGTTFANMELALSYSDKVIKLKNNCEICSSTEGRRSIKYVDGKPQFDGDLISLESDNVSYICACKRCFYEKLNDEQI